MCTYLIKSSANHLFFSADGPPDIRLNIKFVQDTSKYWYKPEISREQGERFNIRFHIVFSLNPCRVEPNPSVTEVTIIKHRVGPLWPSRSISLQSLFCLHILLVSHKKKFLFTNLTWTNYIIKLFNNKILITKIYKLNRQESPCLHSKT